MGKLLRYGQAMDDSDSNEKKEERKATASAHIAQLTGLLEEVNTAIRIAPHGHLSVPSLLHVKLKTLTSMFDAQYYDA